MRDSEKHCQSWGEHICCGLRVLRRWFLFHETAGMPILSLPFPSRISAHPKYGRHIQRFQEQASGPQEAKSLKNQYKSGFSTSQKNGLML